MFLVGEKANTLDNNGKDANLWSPKVKLVLLRYLSSLFVRLSKVNTITK